MHKDPWYREKQAYEKMLDELKELYGDDFKPHSGERRARHYRPDIPYHIITRVFQGRFMLKPSRRLNRIIAGILGRYLDEHKSIKLYAKVVMSNHLHMMLQGEPKEIVEFVRDVKREITERCKRLYDKTWTGSLWHDVYLATALPSHESQLACFRYILSHGAKEELVAKPQDWPGIHSAKQLLRGSTLKGEWFEGTKYGKKTDTQSRTKYPKPIRKNNYWRTYEVPLTTIPPWQDLEPQEVRTKVKEMVDEITEEARIARNGRKPLGKKRILNMPVDTRSTLPRPPWFEKRKAMVAWPARGSKEARQTTRAYLDDYWSFQRAFRDAANKLKEGVLDVVFPKGAFRPGLLTPSLG